MQFVPIDSSKRPYLWGLLTSATFQDLIMKTVTGTTGSRQRAQPKVLECSKTLLAPESLQQQYSIIVKKMLHKINLNLIESETLTQLRDTLLPKLLAGELDLSKIKIDEEPVL